MKRFLTLFFLYIISGVFADHPLPEPYNTAKILPFADSHWYLNGPQLKNLIASHQVHTIIEVGSWLGKSTRHMAFCLPKGGKVYAVDHWKGSSEHQRGGFASSPKLGMLYEYFLSNTIQAGLTDKIIPIRKESLEAAATLDVMADLIYIDASHETDLVYADLVAWHPHLLPNGILCGDDWEWGSVRKAVEIFASERGLLIEASGNFWRLCKE